MLAVRRDTRSVLRGALAQWKIALQNKRAENSNLFRGSCQTIVHFEFHLFYLSRRQECAGAFILVQDADGKALGGLAAICDAPPREENGVP